MALPPTVYATLLMKKIKSHGVSCWLVNTGWSGKPYGEGERIKIAYSRAIVRSILNGALEQAEFERDPFFGFMVPKACEGVPSEILSPATFAPNRAQYEERARKLVEDFKENFGQFEDDVSKEISDAMA